jgi:hypothetical protein
MKTKTIIHMKAFFLVVFLLFVSLSSRAQQVVASAGNTSAIAGYIVAWTLGEPVIETLTGSNVKVTQGMHQTNLVVTDLHDLASPKLEVKVYPNPAGDFLRIEILRTGSDVFHYEFSDITGSRILLKEMQSQSEEIDLSSYVSGIYLLRLYNTRQKLIKIYKIIKN